MKLGVCRGSPLYGIEYSETDGFTLFVGGCLGVTLGGGWSLRVVVCFYFASVLRFGLGVEPGSTSRAWWQRSGE